MTNLHVVRKFLRAEFDAEARGGFPRLSRTPDMCVRHFLDYYRNLTAHDQGALADASTLWGTIRFAGQAARDLNDAFQAHPAWARWRHESLYGRDRDPHHYYSVPLLRTCVAQAKFDRSRGKASSVTAELERFATSIRSIKAPDLRRRVRSVLQPLLGARPSNLGGGDWSYEGVLKGSRVQVDIGYGGPYSQLNYRVEIQSAEPPVTIENVGFETVLGAGLGQWNFIVEENVDDSMMLLGELVTYLAELPTRLPQACWDQPDA